MSLAGILITAAAALAGDAQAGNLTAPFELEHTRVLPAGVRNPRFRTLYLAPTERFNDAGVVEPLGAKLNKQVTWQDLINKQETAVEKQLLMGTLLKNGLDPAVGGPGSTTGEVNTYLNVLVPVLAVGVTEKLTLAVAVPVYRVETSVDTGFQLNSNGQTFFNALYATNPVKSAEATQKLDNAIANKASDFDFIEPASESFSAVGDLKLVGKYRFYDAGPNAIAIKPSVTLPTGRAPDANKLIDVPTGDGQWDAGVQVVYDHNLVEGVTLNANVGYTAQLPDSIERRIPTAPGDAISSDREVVSRDSGDQISLGAAAVVGNVNKGFYGGLGYSYQYMTGTSYTGTAFSAERYSFLEGLAPLQAVHSGVLQGGFSTIDWFKEKKFVYPFQVNLTYSKPLAGRNVATADLITAELVLFF